MDELACNASFMKEVCMLSVTSAVLYDNLLHHTSFIFVRSDGERKHELSQSNMQFLDTCNETIMILHGVC